MRHVPSLPRYGVRQASSAADIRMAQGLRALAFRRKGSCMAGLDRDIYDDRCQHILVEDAVTGALVCCYRVMLLQNGKALAQSYASQFYDLADLARYDRPMLELGRFCIHPDCHDPDILRIAWAALARMVVDRDVALLFGCSSFDGTDPTPYRDALGMLQLRHLAPAPWRPAVKAPEVIRFATELADCQPDGRRAQLTMPPLLRSYLLMGGWVSDHAVIDRHMNTIHVFTGLEISAIPETRKRLLMADVHLLDGADAAG